jgi:large subunit ribosomal protein L17
MRHRVPGHQLGRPADQRKAVLRALATELLRHDEIETTLAKAKAVRSHAEKIITKGKHGQVGDYKALHEKAKNGDKEDSKEVARVVHLRRQVSSYLYDKEVVRKVFDNIAPRYKDRQGGYTRIIKIGPRRGDNSEMAIIQLV